MARPRRSEHTKQALLDTGLTYFSEQGYHGTGLNEVLASVNVPKGSFYNYFDSKEAFAVEVIAFYTESLMARWDRYLTTTEDDPITVIKTVYFTMADEYAAQPQGCLVGNLVAEIGDQSPACTRAMAENYRAWARRFTPVVEQGQEAGVWRRDVSAEAITELFWQTWEGGLLKMRLDGSADVIRRSLTLLLDTLLKP